MRTHKHTFSVMFSFALRRRGEFCTMYGMVQHENYINRYSPTLYANPQLE